MRDACFIVDMRFGSIAKAQLESVILLSFVNAIRKFADFQSETHGYYLSTVICAIEHTHTHKHIIIINR